MNKLAANLYPLPEDLASYAANGELKKLDHILALREKNAPTEAQREKYHVFRSLYSLTLAQYPFNKAALFEAILKEIPDFTEEDFAQLEDEGWLDTHLVEGERRYFDESLSSLLKANPDFARRAGKPISYERPVLDSVIAQLKKSHELRYRLHLKTSLKVKDDCFVPGESYRVHLPLPIYAPQQEELRVIGTDPAQAQIIPCAQQTAFFEEKLSRNRAFSAEYSFTQHIRYCDPLNGNPDKTPVYPNAAPPCQDDLAELPPHLAFTPYLKALARELAEGEHRPVYIAKRFYDFITNKVRYSFVRPYLLIENGAEYAATNLRGDCGIQALCFIALCRIAGIPARWQSGLYAGPDHVGCHDWAWFYTQPWGWLPVDCSFGGSGKRRGNKEQQEFYFGNLDPFRAVFNSAYMQDLKPNKRFMRHDPYDNQRGECETENRGFDVDQMEYQMTMLALELLPNQA